MVSMDILIIALTFTEMTRRPRERDDYDAAFADGYRRPRDKPRFALGRQVL